MPKLILSTLAFIALVLATGGTIAATAIDTDEDGIPDSSDNCTLAPNPEQTDTDNDGFGNRCDADFNNDNIVNDDDATLFQARFGSTYPLFDFNGNGLVEFGDLVILKNALFDKPPGPAAP